MRFLSYLGIAFSLVAILASMGMNYSYMYDQGKTVLESQVLGWLSVSFDGFKSLLPIFIASAYASGKYIKGTFGCVVFTLLIGFALLSAVGFAASNRGVVTGSREAVTSQFKDAAAALRDNRALLSSIKTKRTSGAVNADMASMRQEKRWRSTKGCSDTTAKASITFCKRYFALKSEYENAKEAKTLRIQIATLSKHVADLKRQGAGKSADPQAGIIAKFLPSNFEIKDVQTGLIVFIAVLVEMVAAFGLYLSTGFYQAQPKTNKKLPQKKNTNKEIQKEQSRAPVKDSPAPVTKPKRKTKKTTYKKPEPSEPALHLVSGSKTTLTNPPEQFTLEEGRALIARK